MKSASKPTLIAAALLLAALACAAAADQKARGKDKHWKADKSEHQAPTHRNDERDDRQHRHDDHDHDYHGGRYFNDQQRTIVHNFYVDEFNHGRCPPGLRKKHNGCMPPGLAKQWQIGRPLTRDVIYYDLPPAVVIHLGPPPRGHRYVRVASDILLIAVGTGLVLDAIADLSAL